MSPEQARDVLEREGWTLLDLHQLLQAYVARTDAGFDIRTTRVRIIVKPLPLRRPAKKAAKKVKP